MYDPIIRYNNATYRARVHVSKCTHHALLCKNNGIEFAKYITFYSIIYYEHYKKTCIIIVRIVYVQYTYTYTYISNTRWGKGYESFVIKVITSSWS